MFSDLKNRKKVTGVKQVTRALKNGAARLVFLAEDADPRMIDPVADLCNEQSVAVERIPTMAELGAACDIAVGSAMAAIVD